MSITSFESSAQLFSLGTENKQKSSGADLQIPIWLQIKRTDVVGNKSSDNKNN